MSLNKKPYTYSVLSVGLSASLLLSSLAVAETRSTDLPQEGDASSTISNIGSVSHNNTFTQYWDSLTPTEKLVAGVGTVFTLCTGGAYGYKKGYFTRGEENLPQEEREIASADPKRTWIEYSREKGSDIYNSLPSLSDVRSKIPAMPTMPDFRACFNKSTPAITVAIVDSLKGLKSEKAFVVSNVEGAVPSETDANSLIGVPDTSKQEIFTGTWLGGKKAPSPTSSSAPNRFTIHKIDNTNQGVLVPLVGDGIVRYDSTTGKYSLEQKPEGEEATITELLYCAPNGTFYNATNMDVVAETASGDKTVQPHLVNNTFFGIFEKPAIRTYSNVGSWCGGETEFFDINGNKVNFDSKNGNYYNKNGVIAHVSDFVTQK